MHSVNVVVIKGNAVVELLAYPDTEEGNSKAESVFVAMIKKHVPEREYSEQDIESFLDEGICEIENMDMIQPVMIIGSICLTHSMNEEDTH